jgi:hypothetical protein
MDVDLFARWIKAGVRIDYVPLPLVRMQAGGVSSKNAFKGFHEKRLALLSNGYPKLLTNCHFLSLHGVQVVVAIQRWFRRKVKSGE